MSIKNLYNLNCFSSKRLTHLVILLSSKFKNLIECNWMKKYKPLDYYPSIVNTQKWKAFFYFTKDMKHFFETS